MTISAIDTRNATQRPQSRQELPEAQRYQERDRNPLRAFR